MKHSQLSPEDAIVDMTIGEARQLCAIIAPTGSSCPCCGQYFRIYRRKLNSPLAASLIWLVDQWRLFNGQYIHVDGTAPKFVLRSRELGKLAHWNLVEKKNNPKKQRNKRGLWKPTEDGVKFVDGDITVPSHVYLYDNQVQRFSDVYVTIQQALGDRYGFMYRSK